MSPTTHRTHAAIASQLPCRLWKTRRSLLLAAATSDDERRALCNTADPETGTTPLIVGVKRDNSSVALALIEAGADVHQANKKGWTPSSVAAEFASPKLVQLLASHDPNDKRTEIVR